MPSIDLFLTKKYAEFVPRAETSKVPHNTRGLYALLRYRRRFGAVDVVYVGLAGGPKAGVRGRLKAHMRSKRKGKVWTHFSIFEVWDNIPESLVEELEGLFRHIYRKDSRANRLNLQKKFKKFKHIRVKNMDEWAKQYPRA